MKTNLDNYLRATCEFHVFITIIVAFAMKSDLSHEKVGRKFYDWLLFSTMVVFVLISTVVVITKKWFTISKCIQMEDWLMADEHGGGSEEVRKARIAFLRYCAAASTREDHEILRKYFKNKESTGAGLDEPLVGLSGSE